MMVLIMAMMVNDSNLGDEGEEDSDSDWFGNLCAVDSKVAGAVEDEGDFGDYRGGGDNGNDNDDDDDDCIRNLCAVDSKVAGAVEDYQEMGERSTDCHFRAPYVDS